MIDFFISLLPNNAYFFLFYLFFVVIVSIFLIFFFAKRPKKTNITKDINKKEITIDTLFEIVNNKKSTPADLLTALILFKENFKIEGNEATSFELFKKILNHKNRNKKLFDYFHNIIVKKYSKFEDQLNKIEREALNRD